MAHFILEYSDNLGEDDNSIQALFKQLLASADQTGLFPLKGLRCRAYPCTQYSMADGNPKHAFAHLSVKLGAGRSIEERQLIAEQFNKIFAKHFEPHFAKIGVALSFKMNEISKLKFNTNNIADHL